MALEVDCPLPIVGVKEIRQEGVEPVGRDFPDMRVIVTTRDPIGHLPLDVSLRHRPNRSHTRAARREWSFDRWIRHWHAGCKDAFSMHRPYVAGADEVTRFEHLDAGIEKVLARTGAPRFAIPTVNATSNRDPHYRSHCTDENRQLVEQVLTEDLDTRGHTF